MKGTLEPPKGKLPEDWEEREQTLFRSTAHGDDVDRPVMKSDGKWTYFAPDIAYHYDKVQRGFDQLIDVLGADHGGYVKRLKAVVSALSNGRVPLEVKLIQLGQALQEWRAVQDVEAGRDICHPARCGRAGGRRCDALRHADP
jgi:arginyl-tRNA synthetase